jgi:quercetin dioxygenase-like cupin family protein
MSMRRADERFESYVTNIEDVELVPGLGPEEGWFDMKVQFAIDKLKAGSNQIVFGRATFPPGARHEWHRHPNAEEFQYIVRGEGVSLNGDEIIPVGEGDLVFTHQGEWHGYRNTGETDTVMLWGWCGAGDKASAGYEVRPVDDWPENR